MRTIVDAATGEITIEEEFELEPTVLLPEELRAAMPTLSPRQVRLGLLSIDITEQDVESALAGNAAALIEWRFATALERLHHLVDSLADHFELPPEQVDALWAWAADL